ncbi:hypothetical protein ACQVP2_07370 [Methylobacterium aquaticum]|uniref:hypothetical protein n=1 Tax=Methylobacterium aquaticum TaxID=270351 RepID=UPI003D180D7C
MDASTTLLALGFGRGSHPSARATASQPVPPSPTRTQNASQDHWWSFWQCDPATRAHLASHGVAPPGYDPGAPAQQAPAGTKVAQGDAIDWSGMAAEMNARNGMRRGASGQWERVSGEPQANTDGAPQAQPAAPDARGAEGGPGASGFQNAPERLAHLEASNHARFGRL